MPSITRRCRTIAGARSRKPETAPWITFCIRTVLRFCHSVVKAGQRAHSVRWTPCAPLATHGEPLRAHIARQPFRGQREQGLSRWWRSTPVERRRRRARFGSVALLAALVRARAERAPTLVCSFVGHRVAAAPTALTVAKGEGRDQRSGGRRRRPRAPRRSRTRRCRCSSAHGGPAAGCTGARVRMVGSARPSYTFTGLTNGVSYRFVVREKNAHGLGRPSAAPPRSRPPRTRGPTSCSSSPTISASTRSRSSRNSTRCRAGSGSRTRS